MKTDDCGVLGLSWKTAPSFRAALQRTVRYHIVLTDTSVFELKDTFFRWFGDHSAKAYGPSVSERAPKVQ